MLSVKWTNHRYKQFTLYAERVRYNCTVFCLYTERKVEIFRSRCEGEQLTFGKKFLDVGPVLGDFQNLTNSFLSTDRSVNRIFMKIRLVVFREVAMTERQTDKQTPGITWLVGGGDEVCVCGLQRQTTSNRCGWSNESSLMSRETTMIVRFLLLSACLTMTFQRALMTTTNTTLSPPRSHRECLCRLKWYSRSEKLLDFLALYTFLRACRF